MYRLLILITFFSCAAAFAQSGTALTEDVNSILDDLDRRLSDQENQVLTFEEQRLFESEDEPKAKPSTTLRFKAKTITASGDVDDELKRLSDAVLELDDNIEDLDSRVQMTKQKVLEAARLDNIVNIEGNLEGEHAMSLRSLSVKLDGYLIYELNENNGLWLPSKQIPLYNGPLPPGPHLVEVDGRIVHKSKSNMPLNASGFTSIKLRKDITVNDGTSRQQIRIDLKPEKS